jgi:uncharacterized damage-inducible protein DinB
MENSSQQINTLFVNHSRQILSKMHGQIVDCLGRLDDNAVWLRGSSNQNAVGNLILHLCGNANQWIGSGVGGSPDTRDRPAEFAATGMERSALLQLLERTVKNADAVLSGITAERLLDVIHPQGRTVTVIEAIYQVVGHFQLHTGQIIYATKALTGEDLGFFRG